MSINLALPTSSAAVEETCATPAVVRSISVKLVKRPDFDHSVSPICRMAYRQRAVEVELHYITYRGEK